MPTDNASGPNGGKHKWQQDLLLSWHEKSKRWRKRKRINGKPVDFYFKHSYTEVGYKGALKEWREKEKQIISQQKQEGDSEHDFLPHIREAIEHRQCLVIWHQKEEIPLDADIPTQMQAEIKKLVRLGKRAIQPDEQELDRLKLWVDPVWRHPLFAGERVLWAEREAAAKHFEGWSAEKEPSKQVEYNANRLIASRLKKVRIDQLSPGTWDTQSRHIRYFVAWFGGERSVDDIREETLYDYRDYLIDLTQGAVGTGAGLTQITEKTAHYRMGDCKYFVKHCYRSKAMEHLPRNIDDPELVIDYDVPIPVVYTKQEIKTLLSSATDRMRLFVLLGLNCSMLPADIAKLKQSEVDWKKGTITRHRTKTAKKKQKNKAKSRIPVVTYKLWGETFELLKANRSDHLEVVLLNQRGGFLRTSGIGEDEKIDNNNNILRAFNRLRKSLEIGKSFKTLRATGASTLEEHEIYGRYAQYYLADAPRSITEKHYAQPSDKQFFAATKWLGEQFDIQ